VASVSTPPGLSYAVEKSSDGYLGGIKVKITLRSDRVVTCLLVAEDGRDRLIQSDWDAPGIARSFGWDMKSVQVQNAGYYGVPCDHNSTDGTVTCQQCCLKAGTFIDAAMNWINENEGAEIEDPGYFE
jgi:hypothetical protein